ncbi:MAG TPA: DDE-type integrase/transposase/recombinase, partial [Acidobacteriaceae bacterium]
LNNVLEQDHRTVKKRTWLAKGYGSFQSAWRTLEGIETMSMIRKGRVRTPRAMLCCRAETLQGTIGLNCRAML